MSMYIEIKLKGTFKLNKDTIAPLCVREHSFNKTNSLTKRKFHKFQNPFRTPHCKNISSYLLFLEVVAQLPLKCLEISNFQKGKNRCGIRTLHWALSSLSMCCCWKDPNCYWLSLRPPIWKRWRSLIKCVGLAGSLWVAQSFHQWQLNPGRMRDAPVWSFSPGEETWGDTKLTLR